jgi:hypothetical protein
MDSIGRALDLSIPLGGDLVGGFSVLGSPYTPEVEGGLHWRAGKVGPTTMDGAVVMLSPVEGGYDVEVGARFDGGGSLRVSGIVPVSVDLRTESEAWVTGDLDLEISGAGVPLALASAADPGARAGEGLLQINGEDRSERTRGQVG